MGCFPAGTAPVGGSLALAEIPDLRCRLRETSPDRRLGRLERGEEDPHQLL